MLTDDDRALGHRLAGAWLEQAGEGDAMALAEHFDRGGEPARAVRWYRARGRAGAAGERSRRGDRARRAGDGERRDARRPPAQLRLIQAEAHVWRGELDAAEARALEAAARWPPGSAAWLRAQAQAIIAAAKHGRLDVVERQVGLVGETPCAPDPAARNAQVICLSWAANYLVFGGRTEAADALIVRIAGLAGDFARSSRRRWGWCTRCARRAPRRRAISGRCLGGPRIGAAGVRAGGRSAQRLRGAHEPRLRLLRARRLPARRGGAAAGAGRVGSDGPPRSAAAVQHNLGRVLGQRGELAEAERLERRGDRGVRAPGRPAARGRGAHLPRGDPDRRAATTRAPSARRRPPPRRWPSRRRCR